MNIFSNCHFDNASKESFWPNKVSNFMHGFKSAILAIFQFLQNGTFEWMHKIWNFFWPKSFIWSITKMAIRKNIHNMSQGLPNPGIMQEKVQKGDFLCFRIVWIPRTPGTGRLNQKRLVFLSSKNLYRQCAKGPSFTMLLDYPQYVQWVLNKRSMTKYHSMKFALCACEDGRISNNGDFGTLW